MIEEARDFEILLASPPSNNDLDPREYNRELKLISIEGGEGGRQIKVGGKEKEKRTILEYLLRELPSVLVGFQEVSRAHSNRR